MQAPQQPRKPTRVTQHPPAIMKKGQLSTEMTSVDSSDDVTGEEVVGEEYGGVGVGVGVRRDGGEARTSCV